MLHDGWPSGPGAPEPDTGSELQLISNTEPEPGRRRSVVSVSGTSGESGDTDGPITT